MLITLKRRKVKLYADKTVLCPEDDCNTVVKFRFEIQAIAEKTAKNFRGYFLLHPVY